MMCIDDGASSELIGQPEVDNANTPTGGIDDIPSNIPQEDAMTIDNESTTLKSSDMRSGCLLGWLKGDSRGKWKKVTESSEDESDSTSKKKFKAKIFLKKSKATSGMSPGPGHSRSATLHVNCAKR